jgi:hypothetical protein
MYRQYTFSTANTNALGVRQGKRTIGEYTINIPKYAMTYAMESVEKYHFLKSYHHNSNTESSVDA